MVMDLKYPVMQRISLLQEMLQNRVYQMPLERVLQKLQSTMWFKLPLFVLNKQHQRFFMLVGVIGAYAHR